MSIRQIKRGATAAVQAYKPAAGELVLDTTTKLLYVGNGVDLAGQVIGAPMTGVGVALVGASTYPAARQALGAAKSGVNSDITEINGMTTALSVAQGGTGVKTIADLKNALGLNGGGISKYFESTPQPITLDMLYTVAHGFGVRPKVVGVVGLCINAESGYSPGDLIEVANVNIPLIANNTYYNSGTMFYYDGTNIYARVGSFRAFQYTPKTGGSLTWATAANWNLIFKAAA